MRREILQLMDELSARADIDDEYADQLADIARNAAIIGDNIEANRLFVLADNLRAHALAIRNNLAALSENRHKTFTENHDL